MSHQEEGRIEYADACRVMLDHATERIDATMETMSALMDGSSNIVDDDIREMMESLVETADDVKKGIEGEIGVFEEARRTWIACLCLECS